MITKPACISFSFEGSTFPSFRMKADTGTAAGKDGACKQVAHRSIQIGSPVGVDTAGKRGGGGLARTRCRAGLMGGTADNTARGVFWARLACALAAAAEAAATAACR